MNPYSYTKDILQPNLQLKQTTRNWLHYAVDFPTAHPLRYKKSNTVRGEYFQPRGTNKAALAILLHGVGDFSVIPCRLLAKALAKKGMASFILYSVMHSSRMPKSVKKRFPHLTSREWFESHQISVIDLRQVIDWASSRTEINDEQIAAIGISFGGFISAIAMGIDKRIKAAGLIVTGGNSSKIGWEKRASDFKDEAEYQDIQSSYRQYLDEIAEKGLEKVTPPRESFLTDPMTFAHLLRQRPVLMLNARWDEAIPREAILDFWKEAGEPTLSWFPATHATIWLWYPFIRRKIVNFLKETF
jgi:esterase/lipase